MAAFQYKTMTGLFARTRLMTTTSTSGSRRQIGSFLTYQPWRGMRIRRR